MRYVEEEQGRGGTGLGRRGALDEVQVHGDAVAGLDRHVLVLRQPKLVRLGHAHPRPLHDDATHTRKYVSARGARAAAAAAPATHGRDIARVDQCALKVEEREQAAQHRNARRPRDAQQQRRPREHPAAIARHRTVSQNGTVRKAVLPGAAAMRFYSTTTTFEDPWETVTAAFWRKYHRGNPYVSHVDGACVACVRGRGRGRVHSH
jgi:hypothetical protein